jgi:sporulation protein YlmC with PRC-barrel domain
VIWKRPILVACALPFLAAPALSQTNQPAPEAGASGTTAQSAPAPQPGLRTADPTTVRLTFYTVQPADMPLSNLYELDVYNPQNEKIGEIEDVIVENGKTIKAIVLSVGGFLGVGERYVAVDPASVVITRQGDDYRAVVNTNRDDLRNAPTFKFEGNMKRDN